MPKTTWHHIKSLLLAMCLIGPGILSAQFTPSLRLSTRATFSPSQEAWYGAGLSLTNQRHTYGFHILLHEIQPAFQSFVLRNELNNSDPIAFLLQYKYKAWQSRRWSIHLDQALQIQRIARMSVHNPAEPPQLRYHYPRIQWTFGLSAELACFKKLFLYQSIRMGPGFGRYFTHYPEVSRVIWGSSWDLGIGIRLWQK